MESTEYNFHYSEECFLKVSAETTQNYSGDYSLLKCAKANFPYYEVNKLL